MKIKSHDKVYVPVNINFIFQVAIHKETFISFSLLKCASLENHKLHDMKRQCVKHDDKYSLFFIVIIKSFTIQ